MPPFVTAMNSSDGKPESNILTINVGGQIFQTTKHTLALAGPSSLFSRLADPTQLGPRFVDRDPDLFSVLLSLLRTGNLPSKARALDLQDLIEESKFYGVYLLLLNSLSNPCQFDAFNLEKSQLLLLNGRDSPSTIATTPHGTLHVAHGCKITSFDWSLRRKSTILTHFSAVDSLLALSPQIAAAGATDFSGLQILDLDSGFVKKTLSWENVTKSGSTVQAIGSSPEFLFTSFESGRRNSNTIMVYDLHTLSPVIEIGHCEIYGADIDSAIPATKLSWVPSNSLLMASGSHSGPSGVTGNIKFWDIRSGNVVWEIKEKVDCFSDVTVSDNLSGVFKVGVNSGEVWYADLRKLGAENPWVCLGDRRKMMNGKKEGYKCKIEKQGNQVFCGFPGAVVKFFRWAGYQLGDNHSPYAWNLVVDLLGKHGLFDAMWNAIESMRNERLISLATFASVFGSYVVADRFRDAIYAFDVMEQYGCPRDVVALNSLLSAVCRDGRTENAADFLRVAKARIRPDSDTYAILLEGWEKEGNAACAKETLAEMVADIGWDPSNVPAYDSFLITLLNGPNGINETIKFFETMRERKCFPGLRFFKIALEDCAKKVDVKAAVFIWDSMIGSIGFKPDTKMYNAMIALYCYSNDTNKAMKLLDDMVYNGVFPDADIYNVLFKFLIKRRKLREALAIFNEMTKNEFVLSAANCSAAVRDYMDAGEAYVALKVWKFMIENHDSDLEKTGNLLVVDLCGMDMVPEAVKYAEGMIEKGIKLTSLTLSKLKQSLTKVRKEFVYEDLLRKCRNCSVG